MIRHVVMFRWTDDVDDAHIEATAAGFDRLVETIDAIRSYRHGRDAGLADGNFDYVAVGDFDSPEDYLTYRDHPDHRAFIERFIAGRVAERSAIQYEIA